MRRGNLVGRLCFVNGILCIVASRMLAVLSTGCDSHARWHSCESLGELA